MSSADRVQGRLIEREGQFFTLISSIGDHSACAAVPEVAIGTRAPAFEPNCREQLTRFALSLP
jgi:hypothetical protein